MRKLLLISITLLLISTGHSQQINNFKNQIKKNLGATAPSFTFKTISNIQNGKSSLISPNKSFSISNTLQQPVLQVNDSIRNLVVVSGKPIYFEKTKNRLKIKKIESNEDKFYSFFNSTLKNTKLKNPKEELQITKSTTDKLGITHVKAQQYYKGVKIYGAESYLHIGTQKDIFTGKIYSTDSAVSIIPTITKEAALTSVTTDLKTRTTFRNLSAKEKELLQYDLPAVSLIILDNILSYEISIRPNFIEEWKYFIDAHNGSIINRFNNTHSDGAKTATAYDLNNVSRTIDTYLEGDTYLLINASESMYNSNKEEGMILTFDANRTNAENVSLVSSPNNTWNNKAAVSAHYYAKQTYKYFKNTFNRNSINNEGGNIIALVNLSDELGGGYDNAYWNGKFIAFGTGGDYFSNLAGGLDVVAHELGHGVVENTASLEYYGQSGAINETFADIFGAMVDRDDWFIGEDITKTSFSPSGTMRNMSNPHNSGRSLNDSYWQPNHTSEMYIGEQDNGGVHTNSGIGNYAYYLFATAVTKEKAEQVFYRALTNYLTSKSQFIDFRIAVIQSTKDLYGDNSQEVLEAKKAFDAVGIYEEVQINPAQDYPVNLGQDYLLINNTDALDANTLYKSTTTASTFNALTSTKIKGKVSVTDDGSWAVFVSSDSKIRAISTDPANPQESIISNDAIWDNVAISKDGNRLACITTVVDTAIYVYDFVAKNWGKFKLYNPTTSSAGTNAGGVLYADAIEFDHTGEYLIYDAYNILNSTSGDNISYWDIGFIKVWDKTTNSFGDGTINKLYGSLPEKVSIGNPTFSKNSPYIIAFDYLNSSTNEYAIYGANLLTGKLGLISTNSTIGFPSFSKNDDKVTFSALNSSSKESVATIGLASDKITGIGSASILIIDAKWPVYYTKGIRSLNLAPIANFTADYKSGVAPLSVKYFDLSVNEPTSWNWSFPGGTPSTSNLQNPTVVYNTAGVYEATLTCYNSAGSNIITKTSYISVQEGFPQVLITQVYGGGGNSGATYKSDFIEFYNTTNSDVNIGGWNLYYSAATSSATSNKYEFPTNTIVKANSYFLLKGGDGTGTQPAWTIAFDGTCTLNLSGTVGKVILLKTNAAFTLSTPPTIEEIINNVDFMDYVPFGTTAIPVWGTSMSANTTSTTSARRKFVNGQYQYTKNIGNDFEIVTAEPRNSSSITSTRTVNNSNITLFAYDKTVFIKGANDNETIEIYNLTGLKVFSSKIASNSIQLKNLTSGIYIVKIGLNVFKISL